MPDNTPLTGHLSPEDHSRLAAEAMKPLTPALAEQRDENVRKSSLDGQLRALAADMLKARERFCHDALAAEIQKGHLPLWIMDTARRQEAMTLLAEKGYNWRARADDPFWFALYKGEEPVSVLRFHTHGKQLTTPSLS